MLRLAHAAARAGAWVLGGLRYEAAGALDPVLRTRPAGAGAAGGVPCLDAVAGALARGPGRRGRAAARIRSTAWRDAQADGDEQAQVERIREYIRAGDCYQVNLTTRLDAPPR